MYEAIHIEGIPSVIDSKAKVVVSYDTITDAKIHAYCLNVIELLRQKKEDNFQSFKKDLNEEIRNILDV